MYQESKIALFDQWRDARQLGYHTRFIERLPRRLGRANARELTTLEIASESSRERVEASRVLATRGEARRGRAWQGEAKQREVRQGKARQGEAADAASPFERRNAAASAADDGTREGRARTRGAEGVGSNGREGGRRPSPVSDGFERNRS